MAIVRDQNRQTGNNNRPGIFLTEYANFVVFGSLIREISLDIAQTTHFVPASVDGARVHSQKLYSFGMNFPATYMRKST